MSKKENPSCERLDTNFRKKKNDGNCVEETIELRKVICADLGNLNVDAIKDAVDVIREGGVIAYPTDTVYGLGTDALNQEAVLKIFKIKNRSLKHPLPVAVSGLEMAKKLAFVDNKALKLIESFWPGALTIVLPKKSIIPSIVVGGTTSVGLRMPNHVVPLMIIWMSGLPIVSTSANKHGMPSPLEAEEAIKQIGNEIDLVLDCGKARCNPSTIIDLTNTLPLMVRRGPVTREMIEKIIGHVKG